VPGDVALEASTGFALALAFGDAALAEDVNPDEAPFFGNY